MSKIVTLDSIREAAEKKYGSMRIPVGEHTVELLNPLRMEKAKRNELIKIQEQGDADAKAREAGEEVPERDDEETLDSMLRLLCKTEGQANKLLAELDLAEKAVVFDLYQEATDMGEASDSQG